MAKRTQTAQSGNTSRARAVWKASRARDFHMRGRDFGQKLYDSQCAHLALANHTSALATSSRARDLCCAVATSARNTLTLRMHKSRSRLSHTRSRLVL
ncbi:hypothetical protein JCGZ_23615 [Jatropha curcas]|uniref:Uncharacterized protein n=1 Tax=Jatropha curcas TaxID=180498 RepID=A0A067LDV8_JATCU|nr:hypothetical protein JCGZ_23615 [Jatropha curcas]